MRKICITTGKQQVSGGRCIVLRIFSFLVLVYWRRVAGARCRGGREDAGNSRRAKEAHFLLGAV